MPNNYIWENVLSWKEIGSMVTVLYKSFLFGVISHIYQVYLAHTAQTEVGFDKVLRKSG